MILSNKTYDLLKLIALLVLPVSELVAAFGHIWGLPHATEITASLVALDAFLGAVVKICSDAYKNYHGEDNDAA